MTLEGATARVVVGRMDCMELEVLDCSEGMREESMESVLGCVAGDSLSRWREAMLWTGDE